MKKLLLILTFISPLFLLGQVISNPYFPSQNDYVTITYDAAQGNQELVGFNEVFIHCGVITNLSNDLNDWQHVMGDWGNGNPDFLMTNISNDLHEFSFQIDEYFNLSPNEVVSHLVFVFSDSSGDYVGRTFNGDDIYLPITNDGFSAGFVSPNNETLIYSLENEFEIIGAASENCDLEILYEGNVVSSVEFSSNTSLDFNAQDYGQGLHVFTLKAEIQELQILDTLKIIIQPNNLLMSEPEGLEYGINFTGSNEVTFKVDAPNKDFIYVLGDFNNWEYDINYLMNKDPETQSFWLTIDELDNQDEYRFQYSIDFEFLRIADVYAEKILDPYHDQYIPESNYPDLIEYPSENVKDIVSVFQINDPFQYEWSSNNYSPPEKENLIIYELLIRDFLESQSYTDLIDTLDYIKYIGVNAIELMPISEFDGNNSWGYNPAFYFAPDKMYGSKSILKEFIDECHHRDIAVIMDIALNHSFGSNPQVRMYFDEDIGEWGQPSPDNPWFNQQPRHDFNVGYDYNHESEKTKEFCKRVFKFWVEEYRIDGFRLDLSKGFTQNNTIGNVELWNAYDQSRINILTEYANHIWSNYPEKYFILEHFANNDEEQVLSNNGFLLWGNMHSHYTEASMGYGGDLSWGVYTNRGWGSPNLISYMESHDEERLMFNNINFGNSSSDYFVQMSNTSLARQELSFVFLIPIPGPKMIWQFGEIGYDYSINYCENGTINNNCRTAPKPVRWDYLINPNRVKLLKTVKALNFLKTEYEIFKTSDFNVNLSGNIKKINLYSPYENVCIVGNFGLQAQEVSPDFPYSGTWYNYFEGTSLEVNDINLNLQLEAGEYLIFTDFETPTPDLSADIQLSFDEGYTNNCDVKIFPNPTRDFLFIESEYDIESYEIFDLSGKKLLHLNSSLKIIDCSTLGHGLYTITITLINGEIVRKKLLINV